MFLYFSQQETVSSLRFAARAKHIKNKVRMNAALSADQMRKLIKQLQAEVKRLKEQLRTG